MNKKTSKIFFLNVSIMSLVVTTLFVVGIFYWLYSSAKQNIINNWQSKNFHLAQDVGYYLKTPIDAVQFAAIKVNEMLKKNATNEEILKYLINESEIYTLLIEENETGIYGYCSGEYLDSSGWVPEADYIPQERPWYKSALQANGEVALVEPYKNLQTFTMMMSVSQLLDDKKSVVSMDIFLGKVQKIIDDIIAKEKVVETAMVINVGGVVVAHSNPEEVGKNYKTEKNFTFGNKLIENISTKNENFFEIDNENKKSVVFVEEINSDWRMILILNEEKMFRSLQYIYIFSALTLIIVLGAIFAGFYFINRKNLENEQLNLEIRAIADIYAAMAKIDFETDTIKILRPNEYLDNLLKNDFTNYSKKIISIMKKYSADQSRELLANFIDPSTLEERLKETNTISHEFLNKDEHWMRARFIVVERNSDKKIKNFILAFESIDEDRKQQEHLRELSEMDRMTKIRNRGSGEALVRKKMAEGKRGMFCLMDADKFKSINDNFGHAVGDKVIIAIANCLKKTFREYDTVFRLGGDEFSVFADEVNDEEIGRRIFDRLFDNLKKIDIHELGDREISLSVGATFYPADRNDSFEELYKRADEGLYDSKKIEGNFVTFHKQI